MWKRVVAFLIILFFVLLSDAVLSDWVPGYLQNVLGSPLKMGLMMALSSVVGFVMDLIFPQLLRESGVRKLAGGALVGALVFLFTMLSSTWWSYALIIALGMAAWGIYYELDSFMTQQFVAGVAPSNERSSVWGVVGVVRNLAYFLGPIVGSYVVVYGDIMVVLGAASILFLAYLLFLVIRLPRPSEISHYDHPLDIKQEVRYWIVLGKRVWPILMTSFVVGLIDATFWTSGTVLTDRLSEKSHLGGWFLSAYMFPFLFAGLFVARWGVDEGKKKWAARFLLVGASSLMLVGFVKSVFLLLLVVAVAGLFIAMAFPLIDSVYTDLVARARKGRKHIMGMSSATFSLAYVIGPILSGFISGKLGEEMTFSMIGLGVGLVAIVLLVVTPKKLKLPQDEIQSWK
ncbi:MAG: hypothetical protein DPW11_02575 [bacterium]|nr:MFS transporter [Candidatus Microgenomates bacterium CPR3]MCQ3944636.1 hypothetical protein [bacterium]RIK51167.1 MAG: hypothetical protein DCC61_03370 [Candidatus Microgenomates bacterium]